MRSRQPIDRPVPEAMAGVFREDLETGRSAVVSGSWADGGSGSLALRCRCVRFDVRLRGEEPGF